MQMYKELARTITICALSYLLGWSMRGDQIFSKMFETFQNTLPM